MLDEPQLDNRPGFLPDIELMLGKSLRGTEQALPYLVIRRASEQDTDGIECRLDIEITEVVQNIRGDSQYCLNALAR
jgi:hypothetical protein